MRTQIATLALAASLTGCATTGGDPNVIVNQVANATVQLCGFLPAASTVANLISVFVGGGAVIGQVEQIANEICAAATAIPTPKSSRLRATKDITVVVRNVPVTGHFVH